MNLFLLLVVTVIGLLHLDWRVFGVQVNTSANATSAELLEVKSFCDQVILESSYTVCTEE